MDSIADTTHETWDNVWQMNIVEFLNILCYIKDKNEKRKREVEQWRKTH